MAINKNFVIKNGVQVSTDLIIGDADNNKVGIGTTIPGYDLHIGRGRKSRGGIGATDLVVTGVATVTNLNVTGISTFAGALDVNSTVDFAGDVVFNGTNDITFDQSESALVLNDGAALRVGTSSDFSISHDGSNTILRDNGTGDLQIYASRIELGGASVDETIAMFTENGGAQLFFNNVNKFETTGVGATVFGDLVVSGVTTSARLLVTGISTFSDNVDVNAHVFVGTGVTIQSFGGVSIAGITTVGGNLLAGGDILPDDDGARDLGSSSKEFQDLFIDGTANIDALVADTAKVSDLTDNRVVIAGSAGELEDSGNLTFDGSTLAVTGDETVSGKITVGSGASVHASTGNAAFAGIVTTGGALIVGAGATISGDILPDADGSRDLGSSTKEFQDLFIDGTANIDSLAADTAAIGDLTNNRVVIAGSSGELEDDANLTFDGVKLNVGSGVTIFPHGGAAFAGIVTVGGDLNVQGDIVYDEITGRNLNITGISTLQGQANFGGTLGIGATIFANGNVAISGITTINGAIDANGGANIAGGLVANSAQVSDLTDNRVVIAGSSGELEDSGNLTFDGSTLTVTADVSISDKIVHTGDTNTAIRFPAADTITAETSGTERLRFDSDGRLLYGKTSSTLETSLVIVGNSNSYATNPGVLQLEMGNTPSNLSSLGQITFGSQDKVGARIDGRADQDYNIGSAHGTHLRFLTTPNGSASNPTERLRITSHGDVKVGSGVTFQGNGGVSISGLTTANGGVQVGAAITLATNGNAGFTGIVTAGGGFNIGIQSAGTVQASGPIKTLNFVGTGNTFLYNAGTDTIDISIAGGSGGGGGVSETETSVSTTSATSCGSFVKTAKRSAAILAQITQGSAYQIGRYLLIHDGTTVTTIEEAAVATGDMLGTFEGVINGSNVEFRVTMNSSSSATVTTKIDSISIP